MKSAFATFLLFLCLDPIDSFASPYLQNAIDGEGSASLIGDNFVLTITGNLFYGAVPTTLTVNSSQVTSQPCAIPEPCTIFDFAVGQLTIESSLGELKIQYADDVGVGNFNQLGFLPESGNYSDYVFQMGDPIGILLATGIFSDVSMLQYFSVRTSGPSNATGFDFGHVVFGGPYVTPEPETWMLFCLALVLPAWTFVYKNAVRSHIE